MLVPSSCPQHVILVTSFASVGPMFPEEVGPELNDHGARETVLKLDFQHPWKKQSMWHIPGLRRWRPDLPRGLLASQYGLIGELQVQ